MKVSWNWLSEYLQWVEENPQRIADALTESVGEVDELVHQGEFLEHVVIGEVQTIKKHPNADKLSLCDVLTDQGVKHVVCGGTNLQVGMRVAFAHIGARVKWHGDEVVTLTPVKIRGEASEGMICAGEELGLEGIFTATSEKNGERPILDISTLKVKVGAPLKTTLGLTDTIFHIDNHAITNRPDLFSHIGVARELVALGLAKWREGKAPSYELPLVPKTVVKKNMPEIINASGNLCPHYFAVTLDVDSCEETPEWMTRRLQAVGIRSRSLVVDITNYVMMEIGSPLHSFDRDDFKGPLTIRTSKKGESLTTLDGETWKLPNDILVNGDDTGLFDLVGIMGGARTSMKGTTKHILLQAAVFEPKTIRRAVIQLGKRTDAATIYEKGVPSAIAKMGLARAVCLILKHCKGACITGPLLGWGHEDVHMKTISMGTSIFSRALGIACSDADVKNMLTAVGCTCKIAKATITVTVPVWRPDLTQASDLVEEVARIIGFNKIPTIMPLASIEAPKRDHRLQLLRSAAKEDGFTEFLELSLVSPALLQQGACDPSSALSIENPLGEELSLLRTHLLPALLKTATREIRTTQSGTLRCFEHGHVFSNGKESHQVCLLIAGRKGAHIKEEPYLEIGTSISSILKRIGHPARIVSTKAKNLAPYVHPKRCGDIIVGTMKIGMVYELHPSLQQTHEFPGRVGIAELDWSLVSSLTPETSIYAALPKFPAITYDETVPLTSTFSFAALQEQLRAIDPLLTHVEVIDLYGNEKGSTITLRCIYRSEQATLTEAQAEGVHKKVLAMLKSYTGHP